MVLAALLFIKRVSRTTTVSRVTEDYVAEGRKHVLQEKPIPEDVAIFRIHGPFLFGSTDQLHRVTDDIDSLATIVIFRLRNMTAIDATGLKALEDAASRLRASGRATIFCGAPPHPAGVMARSACARGGVASSARR
jgi:SulP family sulfate permease